MKVRHIIEYLVSCVFLRFFLFQNVVYAQWGMMLPLLIYLKKWASYLGPINLLTSWYGFIGFSMVIIGVSLFLASFFYLWKRRKKLVRTGPYRWIRHPQYLGFIIMTFGISFLTVGSRVYFGEVMFDWMFTAFLYIFLAIYEDESLAREHENYEEYRKEVPFIFPGICSTRIYKKLSSRFMEPLLTIFTMSSVVIFITFTVTLAFWWDYNVVSVLIMMKPLLLILITILLIEVTTNKIRKSIIPEALLLLWLICSYAVAMVVGFPFPYYREFSVIAIPIFASLIIVRMATKLDKAKIILALLIAMFSYIFLITQYYLLIHCYSLLNLGRIAIFFSLNVALITVVEKIDEKLPLGFKTKMMIALAPLIYTFAFYLYMLYTYPYIYAIGVPESNPYYGLGVPFSVIITIAILMKILQKRKEPKINQHNSFEATQSQE